MTGQRRREPPSTGASRSRIDVGSAGGSAATSAMASAIARQLHRKRSGGMFNAGCSRYTHFPHCVMASTPRRSAA